MANRILRKIILAGMLAAMPLASVSPATFTWGSDSGQFGTVGHSRTFFDTVPVSNKSGVDEFGGRLIFDDNDVLQLDGVCSVSGDVILDAAQRNADVRVVVGDFGGSLMNNQNTKSFQRGYVLVRPDNADSDLAPIVDSIYSHLAFKTSTDHKIDVECTEFSLAFTDSWNKNNALVNQGNGRTNIPLHISFWGNGQVNFRMKDGCCIVFRGQVPDGFNFDENLCNPAGIGTNECGCFPIPGDTQYDQNITNSGVRVFVIMDQTATQEANGECKLVFSRFQFVEETPGQNPKTKQPADVWIGEHAYVTYLSSNATGAIGAGESGFGSIGFDPSAQGTSRLTLRILGGPGDDGTDGALVVCGHRMPDTVALQSIDPTLPPEAAARFFELNHMAGVQASMKIVDELSWANNPANSTDPTFRRGLMVINGNKTIPFFASNPYSIDRENPEFAGPFGNSFFQFAAAGQIRNGFVLGVNGALKVFQNTFLDYVGTTSNRHIPESLTEYGAPFNDDLKNVTKTHNPSALIVDGLTTGLQPDGAPFQDPFAAPANAVAYTEFLNGKHAKIILCGDGTLYLRNAKSAVQEVDPDVLAYDCNGDCVYSLTVGTGPFELSTDPNCPAWSVPALNPMFDELVDGDVLVNLNDGILGEGFHVLDVEGRLTMASVDDTFVQPGSPGPFVRHPGTNTVRSGVLNVPSVRLNHQGFEEGLLTADGSKTLVTRPLEVGGATTVYPRYQSSVLFFNGPIDYPNFGAPTATLFDINWHQTDVTKAFNVPDAIIGEPSVVGGARAIFEDRFPPITPDGFTAIDGTNFISELPVIRLNNSTIHVRENIISSGVRYEVTEANELISGDRNLLNHLYGTDADNVTRIISYNRGDLLDTRAGRGRVFMLGTQQNLTADNIPLGPPGFAYQSQPGVADFDTFYNTPFPLTNAFINVYRRTQVPTSETPTNLIRLMLLTAFEGSSPTNELAKHLLYLANKSHVALGWFPENGDFLFHPWWNTLAGSSTDDQFTIAGNDVNFGNIEPAELRFGGNFYWVGGTDGRGTMYEDMFGQVRTRGSKVVKPVVSPFDPRAVFVNHGGKVSAADYIDTVFDTTIARLLSVDTDLSGRVDIPMDQIRFTKNHGVQPYNLDLTGGDLHLIVLNADRVLPAVAGLEIDRAGGEEVVIDWLNRNNGQTAPLKPEITQPQIMGFKDQILRATGLGDNIPVRGMAASAKANIPNPVEVPGRMKTRATVDIPSPVEVPEGLLFVTTGDYIRQMRVMGATCADPFTLHITGDTAGFGRIREFCTQPMDLTCELVLPVYGDGDYAALVMDGGGRIGLGQRDWNEHSNSTAWSRLGWDYVTIFCNGNGVIDVNSDLIIADKLPLVATTNFGNVDSFTDQRIEFFSEDNRVVRIPAGHELDLCTFGQHGRRFTQQIAFGGNVRLVFEPGSILRFPDGAVVDAATDALSENAADPSGVLDGRGPVLYMNDNSILQFEGNDDRDEGRFANFTGFDAVRCKIMGKGQIWLNKDARLEVLGSAAVGIEADSKTPNTEVEISIQTQAQMLIGTPNTAGGQFQVGNVENREGTTISFRLRLAGPDANFLLEREGFFGLGVGCVNKFNNINGLADPTFNPTRTAGPGSPVTTVGGKPVFTPDLAEGWRVQQLYNVNSIDIRIIQGTFDHSNIFDGSDSQGSLMAIGPYSGTCTFQLGATGSALVLGGGNVMYLHDDSSNAGTPNTLAPNIWSFADPLVGDATDNGKYSILASTPILRQRQAGVAAQNAINSSILVPTAGTTLVNGGAIEGVLIGTSKILTTAAGAHIDLFNFLAFPNYPLMLPTKFVNLGATIFDTVVGFVNNGNATATPSGTKLADGTNIDRITDALAGNTDGVIANAEDGLPVGVLGGNGVAADLGPEQLNIIKI